MIAFLCFYSGQLKLLRQPQSTVAALLKPNCVLSSSGLQNDIEREELRVERALQESTRLGKADQITSAATEAASGIDAFEMTLKRLCGDDGSSGGGSNSAAGNSPQPGAGTGPREAAAAGEGTLGSSSSSSPLETLNRLKGLAPALGKLQQESGEYLAAIKGQRKEDLLIRREREVSWSD